MRRRPWLALLALPLLLVLSCGKSASSSTAATPPAADEPPAAAAAEAAPADVAPAPVAQTEPPVAKHKVVVLDPGHGGDEVGAAANGVVEKVSNLDMALRVEKLLAANGVDVVLTRRADERAAAQIAGYTAARSDLQARLDLANAVHGDLLVSIHSNGSTDTSQRGVEAWFDSSRGAFADESHTLAATLLSHVLGGLRGYGYAALDRGLFDGKCFRQREGTCFTLFVIAGPRLTTREEIIRRGGDPAALGFGDQPTIYSRPAAMPAALIELLIISNPTDATVLRDEAGRQAMALGLARGILDYLGLPFQPS